jgi:hypothetical protein
MMQKRRNYGHKKCRRMAIKAGASLSVWLFHPGSAGKGGHMNGTETSGLRTKRAHPRLLCFISADKGVKKTQRVRCMCK